MAKSSRAGREEFVSRIQAAFGLYTKKEAEHLVNVVLGCLEETLLSHLQEDGFSMKLNSFGKFAVHHRPAAWKKVGFSGETTRTTARRKIRFVSLGRLRELEPMER